MLIITPKSKIDEYFESDALSQSKLKNLAKGMHSYLAYEKKQEREDLYESTGFLLGSAIDCKLTGELENFNNDYYVSTITKYPSGVIRTIIHTIFNELSNNNIKIDLSLSEYDDMIIIAAADVNFGNGKYTRAGILKKVCTEEGLEYFKSLLESDGKSILNIDQKITVDAVCNSLQSNPLTAKYFNREEIQNTPNIEVYYQYPIYFIHEGLTCKALLDILIIVKNNEGDIIKIVPVDLKSMAQGVLQFKYPMKSYRYDIQAAWYTLAVAYEFMPLISKKVLELTTDSPIIGNFKFLVESTQFTGRPLIYTVSDSLLQIAREGRVPLRLTDTNLFSEGISNDYIISPAIKGIKQLVEDYMYYEEQGWKEEKIIHENEGELTLTWDDIL